MPVVPTYDSFHVAPTLRPLMSEGLDKLDVDRFVGLYADMLGIDQCLIVDIGRGKSEPPGLSGTTQPRRPAPPLINDAERVCA